MARPALARASRAIALVAIAAALIRSVVAVWFSSEIIETPRNELIATPPLTDRVVLVVIDGLRYDTALQSELMPKLQAIGRAGSAGMSMASLVTMTGLGVRTLGTGTSPALADILLEANLPPVTFDNVFASLRRRGGHITWFGNASWKELFGEYIDLDPKISRSLDMLSRANNVWPADSVIVRRAVAMMANDGWQLAIVHLGGLDNASHRFTPFGEAFKTKARAVDADIARLVDAAGPRTTVIITSDHGTSDRGHHGSGEPITRRTPLVFTGAAVAHGHVLDAQQTDVAPTIAALLGLPIPAPSEGQIVFDALDMPQATSDALRTANVDQLQRYARAYAVARDIPAPTIDGTPAGMRRLGEWIERTRTTSSLIPALWAMSLLLLAMALFGDAVKPWFSVSTTSVVLVAAGVSVATGGRGELAALLALAAALLEASAALWHLPRRWRPIGAGVASLAAIELAMGMWKLHHRFIEMKMHDVYDLVHASDQTFQLAMTAAVAAIATLGLRRWWQHTPATRWATVFIVVAASALADSLAIPAAIVGGIATAGALGRCREVVVLAVAAALGIAALGVVDSPVVARVPFELIAPLALALLGIWLGPCRLRARLALVALGLMTTAVRLAGDPALPYRATLIIIGVVALVVGRVERQRDARSLVFLGWAGAIALSMLSRSAQLPGLIAWTAVAALIGRSDEIAQSDERAVITAVLGVIGFRFACFALFEGAFEFSHLEVWLAYQGNPGTAVAFGAAIIAIKFALPLAIGFALVTARLTAAARRTTLLWTGAFFALRIAHIVVGMTVARGTFYSPYLDSGQLVFTYLMGVSAPLVVALLAIVGAWRESAR